MIDSALNETAVSYKDLLPSITPEQAITSHFTGFSRIFLFHE
jgi:hypothetical protein